MILAAPGGDDRYAVEVVGGPGTVTIGLRGAAALASSASTLKGGRTNSRVTDTGADRIYLHNVDRNQEYFLSMMGERVLPHVMSR